MIFAAIALTSVVLIKPRWEQVMLIDFPNKNYFGSASYDPTSKNVMYVNDVANGSWDAFLYLSSQNRYVKLGICHGGGNQFDNGAGLFDTVSSHKDPRTRNFVRYSDGKRVGSVPRRDGTMRIGSVLQTEQDFTDLNGKLLWRGVPPSFEKSTPGYLGRLIWNGTRRFAIIGKNDMPSDVKEVVEILPSWKKGKRVWLSDYAMGFSGIVGNPDTGAFAVFEESNRSRICTGVFSRDLRRLISGNVNITDIGPLGILGHRVKLLEYGDTEMAGKPFCLDGVTGKVLWHSQKGYSMYWKGDKVICGNNVLDGKTGKVIGRVPSPPTNFKQQFGFFQDTFVAFTRDNRIAVYQLKL